MSEFVTCGRSSAVACARKYNSSITLALIFVKYQPKSRGLKRSVFDSFETPMAIDY